MIGRGRAPAGDGFYRGGRSLPNLNEMGDIQRNLTDDDFVPVEDHEYTPPGLKEKWITTMKTCAAILVLVHFILLLIDPTPFYRALALFDRVPKECQSACSSLSSKNFEVLEARLQTLEFEVYRLTRELNNLTISQLNLVSDVLNEFGKNSTNLLEYSPNLEQKLSDALSLYDADKLGIIDYAMESAGGFVISTPGTNPYPSEVNFRIMGVFELRGSSNPNLLLQPGTLPGQCFAFYGSQGRIRIKLAQEIHVTSVTLEHAHKSLVSNFKSCPKEFQVYGLKDKGDGKEMDSSDLGMFTYLAEGSALQSFKVDGKNKTFEIVELKILNNYGNTQYTCVYRFRVHGNPVSKEDSTKVKKKI